jgi:hypothetical protein
MDSPCTAMKCWCPYKREKSYSGHFFHLHVSDIRLWQMTVYSMEKRRQHCQAGSFISDFDDVNFAGYRSEMYFSFLRLSWTASGWFDSRMYAATIHKQPFIVSRTKSRPTALWFINRTQQLVTAIWIIIVNTFKKESPDHKVSSQVKICNWRSRMCP